MRHGSTSSARVAPARRSFPVMTGPGVQRLVELLALRVAPAFAAGAIAYVHLLSEWQGLLVFVCVLGAGTVLRHPNFPLHLIPFASAILYLLAAPLGAALAVAISAWDGYPASHVALDDIVAPVFGAWAVTAVGALIARSFRRYREVRVAVIGSHEFTRGLQAELDAVGVRGYRVLGSIELESHCDDGVVAGIHSLGSLADLRGTLVSNGIELLVLGPLSSLPNQSGGGQFHTAGVSRLDVFERVADACLDLPVSMIEAGQLYEELFGHVPLGTTTSAWFQFLLHPRYRAGWPLSKRLLDLGLGTIAALLAAPILVIAAIAIKLTDRGPVLHRQVRMGEAGREFELIKLRTMTPYDGPQRWTGDDDDRITTVGRLLRRLHIDELPQIWLVLKGEMSLVGPRPEQPAIVTELESRFSYYDRRHLVKPGITGWAQVRCGYGGSHIGSAWKLCHDLFYLKHRSMLFDLLIMLETLSTVLFPEQINRPDERFIVATRGEEALLATPRDDELPASLKAT